MSKNKLVKPSSLIIEQTAVEFACTFYEVGRSNGMTSKYKTHKEYARANWPKFLPRAIDALIDMLNLPHVPKEQKDLIMEALKERKDYGNDPLPEIDISKLISTKPKPPIIINTERAKPDFKNEPLPIKV